VKRSESIKRVPLLETMVLKYVVLEVDQSAYSRKDIRRRIEPRFGDGHGGYIYGEAIT
jgi:hypothetical protein